MKRRILLALLFLMASANIVYAEEFVDKRFARELIPFSHLDGKTWLKPTQISYDDNGEKFYEDCQLLENKIGFLKFECTYVYNKNHPLKNKSYSEISIFEIYPTPYEKNYIKVKNSEYEHKSMHQQSIRFFRIKSEEFVDKHFTRELVSSIDVNGSIWLAPTQIFSDNYDKQLYNDCQLLENKIDFIKFECTDVYKGDYPSKKESYNRIISFQIKRNHNKKDCIEVKRLDYEKNSPNLASESSYCIRPQEFVDKRFTKKLLPLSYRGGKSQLLTPIQILRGDNGEKNYEDCQLLENKIGFLKFKCTYPYTKNHPLKNNDYEFIVSFEIYPNPDQKDCIGVERLDYDYLNPNIIAMHSRRQFCIKKE